MPAPALDIGLQPSRYYGIGLCGLYLLTCLVLWTAALSPLLRALVLVLMVLLGLRAGLNWRNLAFWQRLLIQQDRIQLLGEGKVCDGVLASEPLQFAWLVILPLRFPDGGLRLPLLTDSMAAEDWRRLRVWLNSGAGKLKH